MATANHCVHVVVSHITHAVWLLHLAARGDIRLRGTRSAFRLAKGSAYMDLGLGRGACTLQSIHADRSSTFGMGAYRPSGRVDACRVEPERC